MLSLGANNPVEDVRCGRCHKYGQATKDYRAPLGTQFLSVV